MGRLSNLYLFTGAYGRNGGFKAVDSCCAIIAVAFGLWDTGFSNVLFLLAVISAWGDATEIPESDNWEASLTSAKPVLGLLAAGSATTSPLSPKAC